MLYKQVFEDGLVYECYRYEKNIYAAKFEIIPEKNIVLKLKTEGCLIHRISIE